MSEVTPERNVQPDLTATAPPAERPNQTVEKPVYLPEQGHGPLRYELVITAEAEVIPGPNHQEE